MSRNGSGTYSLVSGNPVVTGTTISSTWANNTLNDIATALTQSLAYDGQTTPIANLPMGGFKLTGMANGSALTDSATLGNIINLSGQYVATVGGTANAITLTPSPAITAYAGGQAFTFKAASNSTSTVTIAISGLATKAVQLSGVALAANEIRANAWYTVLYDGTQFQLFQCSNQILNVITNTVFGNGAYKANTSGGNGVAIGINALAANTSGNNHCAIGFDALQANIIGDNCTAVGFGAASTSNSDEMTAVGAGAFQNFAGTGKRNTGVGVYVGQTMTDGSNNTLMGYNAGQKLTTASNNVVIGATALQSGTSADGHVAVGAGALASNTTADNNVAVGLNALTTNITGDGLVAIGASALLVGTGANNTACGYLAGTACSTGGQNTYIGTSAGSAHTTGSNCTLIGYLAAPSAITVSNEITLGNTSVTALRLPGSAYFEINEMSAPSAGGADTARIFAVDNGGGKTVLKVIFSSGAAQTIATQP